MVNVFASLALGEWQKQGVFESKTGSIAGSGKKISLARAPNYWQNVLLCRW
jgi:hypothetical protein